MQLVGKILWWNDRDGFGVIEDSDGNEYYFDSSVIGRSSQSIKRNSIVVFEVNKGIRDCLCAHKVKVANATERKRAGRNLNNKQLKFRMPEAGAK